VSIENRITQLSENDRQLLLDSFKSILQTQLQSLQDKLKEDFQTQLQTELQPIKDQLNKLERELKKQKSHSQREMLI
jgi:hypothetical protein